MKVVVVNIVVDVSGDGSGDGKGWSSTGPEAGAGICESGAGCLAVEPLADVVDCMVVVEEDADVSAGLGAGTGRGLMTTGPLAGDGGEPV